jgi:broad specificity phosphatase PhoE
VQLLVSPDLQESEDAPCNTGSSLQTLQSWFAELDYSSLSPPWPQKVSIWAPTPGAIKAMAAKVQEDLKAKIAELKDTKRTDVVLVSHSGFLAALADNPNLEVPFASWRSYTIRQTSNGEVTLEPV